MRPEDKEGARLLSLMPGQRWRLRFAATRDEDRPPAFRTERIEGGRRHGTFPVRIKDVCPAGCHIRVQADDGHCLIVDLEDLLPEDDDA